MFYIGSRGDWTNLWERTLSSVLNISYLLLRKYVWAETACTLQVRISACSLWLYTFPWACAFWPLSVAGTGTGPGLASVTVPVFWEVSAPQPCVVRSSSLKQATCIREAQVRAITSKPNPWFGTSAIELADVQDILSWLPAGEVTSGLIHCSVSLPAPFLFRMQPSKQIITADVQIIILFFQYSRQYPLLCSRQGTQVCP